MSAKLGSRADASRRQAPAPRDMHRDATLDRVFAALSDSTRRRVLADLASSERSVSELASAHAMSLPGFMKHLAVLEAAGLIARSKEGRVVRCALDTAPMQEAAMWLARYERFWNDRLDALGRYLYHQQEVHAWKAPPSANPSSSSSAAPTRSRRTKSGRPGPTRKR